MTIRYCFVLSCNNNSRKNPEKYYFRVPYKKEIRKNWCEATGRRIESLAARSEAYCCSDHFNEEDFEQNQNNSSEVPKLKIGVTPYLHRLDSSAADIVGYVSHIINTSNEDNETNAADSTSSSEVSVLNLGDSNDTDWVPSSDLTTGSEAFSENDEITGTSKNVMKDLANKKIEVIFQTPSIVRDYFGLDSDKLYLVDEIVKIACISRLHILICLQKIKQNLSFKVLGFEYGLSDGYCGQIFRRTISVLAKATAKFVTWRDPDVTWHRLPIAFRAHFREVVSIIDYFEIEIQKPSNPVYQAHTWSDYKKCNTVKYLVSSTPDGIINFISEGFGGRITDLQTVKSSGYLNVLPPNSVVMADRGFKAIETILQEKNCRLVRPPSVSEGEPMSKDDVRLTKQVAALRIHIERVIKRFREFAMLRPHSTVNSYLISSLNDVVNVAAAISNTQNALIR